jgi:hypothetical protein
MLNVSALTRDGLMPFQSLHAITEVSSTIETVQFLILPPSLCSAPGLALVLHLVPFHWGPFFGRVCPNWEKRLIASPCVHFRLSVRPSARNKAVPTGRIFMKFDI